MTDGPESTNAALSPDRRRTLHAGNRTFLFLKKSFNLRGF